MTPSHREAPKRVILWCEEHPHVRLQCPACLNEGRKGRKATPNQEKALTKARAVLQANRDARYAARVAAARRAAEQEP
jgi:hypothetical protein